MKASLFAALVCCAPSLASAAELRIVATNNMRTILTRIVSDFERGGGYAPKVVFDTGGTLVRRIANGEAFDVIITQRASIDELAIKGVVERESIADFARSSIDIIVRAGAAKPDTTTIDSLKNALLASKRVAYTDPASGGLVGTYTNGVTT